MASLPIQKRNQELLEGEWGWRQETKPTYPKKLFLPYSVHFVFEIFKGYLKK